MFEDQMTKVASGLVLIVPAILLLRWFLTRHTGNPDQWAERQISELERRYARGEMDRETYERLLKDLRTE